jgi:hypothetical protein
MDKLANRTSDTNTYPNKIGDTGIQPNRNGNAIGNSIAGSGRKVTSQISGMLV